MKLHNQKGFSLVGVLIASSIALIMISAIGKLFSSQSMNIAKLNATQTVSGLTTELSLLLSNPANCLNAFKELPISEPDIGSDNFEPSVERIQSMAIPTSPISIVEKGERVPNIAENLVVKKIYLANWKKVAGNFYMSDLVVEYETHLGSLQPSIVKAIQFKTEPKSAQSAKVIVSCRASRAFSGGKKSCSTANHDAPSVEPLKVYCSPGETLGPSGAVCLSQDIPGKGPFVPNPKPWTGPGTDGPKHYLTGSGPAFGPLGEPGWAADCHGPGGLDHARVRVQLSCCR